MRDFVESHKCNAVCRHLGLPDPNAPVAAPEPPRVNVVYALSAYVEPPVRMPFNYERRPAIVLPPVVFEEEEESEEEESEKEYEYEYEYDCAF